MEEPQLIVPVPETVVSGGSIVRILVRAPRGFRPRYLVVPRGCAPDFFIDDIKIERRSQFHAAEGSVPAAVFSGDVEVLETDREDEASFLRKTSPDLPVPLQMDACDEWPIEIDVVNRSPATRLFQAVIFGTLDRSNTLADRELAHLVGTVPAPRTQSP